MTWEENPKSQKFQFGLMFCFLIFCQLIGLLVWWFTGKKEFALTAACVLAGLLLSWACAALIMVLVLRLLKKKE